MSTKIATAILEIKTDTSTVLKDLGGLEKKGADVGKAFQKVALDIDSISFTKLVGGIVSAQALINGFEGAFHVVAGVITDSIAAAGEAEKAHVQVAAALRAQGTAIPSVIAAYDGYASALQRTTIFQDDAIEGAEALLVQVGNVMPRDMKQALDATTELASGLGIDLNAAAMVVAKAAEGNTVALKKMGVEIDATKVKQEGFGAVLDAITDKFGGQAEAIAGTYQGRLEQLGNTWNNVEESIGRVITQNGTVLRAFDLINQAIAGNTTELNASRTANDAVSLAVIGTAKAVSIVLEALDLAQTAYAALRIASNDLVRSFINIGIAALDLATVLVTAGKYLNPGNYQAAAFALQDIADASDVLKSAVALLNIDSKIAADRSAAWGNQIQGLKAGVDGFTTELEKTRGKTVAYIAALGDLSGEQIEAIHYYRAQGLAVGEIAKKLEISTKVVLAEVTAWERHTKAVAADADAAKKAAEAIKKAAKDAADLAKAIETGRKAIVKQFDDYLAAQKAMMAKSNEAIIAGLATEVAARRAVAEIIARETLSAADFQAFQINREFEEKRAALELSLGLTQQYYRTVEAMEAEHQARLNAIDTTAEDERTHQMIDPLKKVKPAANEARDSLGDLTHAFAELAQIAGASFGGVLKDIATMTAALKVGQQAAANANIEGASAAATVVSGWGMAMAYYAIVQKGVDYLNKWTGAQHTKDRLNAIPTNARELRAFIDQMGGIEQIMQITGLSAAVMETAFRAALDAETPADFAAAMKPVIDALDKAGHAADILHEATSQFGLNSDELLAAGQHAHDIYDAMVASGKYSAGQIAKAFEAFQEALAATGDQDAIELLKKFAAAGDEAAAAWLKAHDIIVDAASATTDALKALQAKRDDLAASYATEAPEESMGVIEANARAQVAALEDRIAQEQAKIAEAAAHAAEVIEATVGGSGDTVKDKLTSGIEKGLSQAGSEAESARSAIADAFEGFAITIPINYEQHGGSGSEGDKGGWKGGFKMAEGGFGRVSRPTAFLAGDAGAEDVIFGGAGRHLARDIAVELAAVLPSAGSGGSAAPDQHITLQLDSQVISETLIRQAAMDKRGAGTKWRRALGVG